MPHSDDLVRLWPAAGLRVRSGDLELRWIDDDLLVDLARLAAGGVHPPDVMPFEHPWTRGTAEEIARSVLTYQWNARPRVSPEGFTLELAVLRDGIPVGIQGLDAENWAVLRRVQTGSWLGRAHQGRGIGTRMRMLALHLIFDGLDAREATSGAFADNVASNAVSRRVGYLADGAFRAVREGAAVLHNRYVMPRARWESLRDEHRARLGSAVEIEGLPAFRNQVGLDPVG